MKTNKANLHLLTLALLPAAVLALASCSSSPESKPPAQAASAPMYEESAPGGVKVRTYEATATVAAVDKVNRKVTLTDKTGKSKTVKVGPEVVNFNQIAVGDQLKITVAEEIVVKMAEPGASADDGASSMVALAPVGSKPGALMADTVQVTAEVTNIDLKNHKATLRFPDGSSQTFPVRKDVNLAKRRVGEKVTIRATEAVAITVRKT